LNKSRILQIFFIKVGKNFYKVDIDVKLLTEKEELDMIHATYQLTFRNKKYSKIDGSVSSTGTSRSQKCKEICVIYKNKLIQKF